VGAREVDKYMRTLVALLILTVLAIVECSATTYSVIIPIKQKGSGTLFRIQREGKWGYIDRSGNVIIAPHFDDASDFMCGLANVRIAEKWPYISVSGELAIGPQFDRPARGWTALSGEGSLGRHIKSGSA